MSHKILKAIEKVQLKAVVRGFTWKQRKHRPNRPPARLALR